MPYGTTCRVTTSSGIELAGGAYGVVSHTVNAGYQVWKVPTLSLRAKQTATAQRETRPAPVAITGAVDRYSRSTAATSLASQMVVHERGNKSAQEKGQGVHDRLVTFGRPGVYDPTPRHPASCAITSRRVALEAPVVAQSTFISRITLSSLSPPLVNSADDCCIPQDTMSDVWMFDLGRSWRTSDDG